MNRVRFPFICLVAAALAVPGSAASQTLAMADAPAVAAEGPLTASPAEQLRPYASTPASAALFSPIRAETPFDEAAQPYRQIEIEEDRDEGGVPYMIAGGVLFIAGAVAGGDVGTILMLGGAGAGAYGAFVYFGGD